MNFLSVILRYGQGSEPEEIVQLYGRWEFVGRAYWPVHCVEPALWLEDLKMTLQTTKYACFAEDVDQGRHIVPLPDPMPTMMGCLREHASALLQLGAFQLFFAEIAYPHLCAEF